MKKLFIIAALVSSALFVACNGETKTDITTEEVGVGANSAVEAMEAVAGADTTLACACEHGCKTKEECIQHCGEGCGALKE